MTIFLKNGIAILIGYLLGSILPAYLLCRIFKGIDIRRLGTGNPGTLNLRRSVGLRFAIPTAIYDTLKGIVALILARYLFDLSPEFSYLCALAAVLGHIFPFYLRFRGGQGAATSTGLLLYSLLTLTIKNKHFLFLLDFTTIIGTIILTFIITRKEDFLSITILPQFCFYLLHQFPFAVEHIVIILVAAYLIFLGIVNIIKFKLFHIDLIKFPQFKPVRTLLRPLAMSFPLLSFYLSKQQLLTLIGSVLALFFALDIIRITIMRKKSLAEITKLYKIQEERRISSMTIFLLGCFLSFLLFQSSIAILAIAFLIFGDLVAVLSGMAFGKHPLFGKSLEGSLGHLMASIVTGYIFHFYLDLPLFLIWIGSVTATIAELIPFGIDDNLSVPMLSGGVMTALIILS